MMISLTMMILLILMNLIMKKNNSISINLLMLNFIMFLMINKSFNFLNNFFWFLNNDFYSFYLILMTIWITSLMMLYKKMMFMKLYTINIMIMLIILTMTFLSYSFMMFYFLFEISMIPTFILIIGWGTQIERLEAGMYMMMYTLFASLPMMITLIKIFNMNNSLNMLILNNSNIINNIYMYMYMLMAFLIKMPMFMTHLWLPKAHVEAPISGSMILAAIMLKLGSYGMLRIMMIMENMCMKYNILIISFSLFGSLYISMICLQQIDMKMLIAYSSVVHMNILISNLLTMSQLSYISSLIMMISHGLCSSALFFIININYERMKNRSIMINKGMMNLFPSLTLFWFILSIYNTASPPSLNMFCEIMMILNLNMWNSINMIMLMLISMTTMIYMMFFYSNTQHGKLSKNLNYSMNINMKEFINLILHTFPLTLMILMF